MINIGLVAVSPGSSDREVAGLKKNYGDQENWANKFTKYLREDLGFNGAGAWSTVDLMRGAEQPFRFDEVDLLPPTFDTRQPHHPVTQERQRELRILVAAAHDLPALREVGTFVAVGTFLAREPRQRSQRREHECVLQKIASIHAAIPFVVGCRSS